jgi:hypothetical protein
MTISKEIINVLDYLGKQFGIAIDWTSENVMPYLEELAGRYIKYEVFTSIAWMIAIPAITLLITIPLPILHKKAKEHQWSDCYVSSVFAVVLWIVFVIMCFASIIVVCTQVFDIIECHTLPEKVILEELKSLINTQAR